MTTYSGCVSAAEWSVEPYVNASVLYDDNILFSTTQPKDTLGLHLPVGISLNRNTEIDRASVKASLFIREYDDPDVIDSVDQHLDIDVGHYGERNQLGLQAGYHADTTTFSEINTTGPVQLDRDVTRKTLTPFWNFLFTERSSLQLSYSWFDADYDALPSEFTDYTYQIAQLGYRYQFSPRADISLEYGYSDLFIPDRGISGLPGVESTTTTNIYTLGSTYHFSETLSVKAQIGYRDTSEETRYVPLAGQPTTTVEGTGRLYDVSFTDKGETLSWTISANRDLLPNGSDGSLNETDKIQMNFNWRTGVTTHLIFGTGYIETQPSVTSLQPGRKYYWMEPAVWFGLARGTSLRCSYRYSRQEYENNPDQAESNRFMITLNHAFTKQSWN